MEFEKIRSVVRLAEYAVVDRPPLWVKEDGLRALSEELLVGPWLVMSGFGIIWKRLLWIFLLTFVFVTGLCLLETAFDPVMVLAALSLSVVSVYFGLPTRTVLAGVTAKSIGKLAVAIEGFVKDKAELERLSSGVQLVKTQTTERMARFNVFFGILWGALFWLVTARVLSPAISPDTLKASIFPAIAAAISFTGLFVVAAGHAVAVRVAYQTLDFALLEVKGRLASAPPAHQTHGSLD
ncbi:hypothetical protein [Stenotrophomonas maltophilia]|uniref:hypothetical protein n=1 Tax=Bacteria TaxID=2 RepID=UPI000D0B64D0|nr:hypothetical protein [Stenotrophomonas maltophilia]AVO30498.1 hypothetical protein C6Y55_11455 [Stenotrophomonas maltophilia]